MPSCNDEYEVVCDFTADGVIPITKYVSKTTGMKIYNVKVNGPRVVCHVALATEAHENDGLPYAVQHLIFMGSESHPHQGILKKLTQNCETLSCWISSSVSNDHSSFEIHAVGIMGILNLLPVLLEHMLYPTLTEEAFLTEIHHINGEGMDAGSMYCERMTCENDAESLCQQALYQAIYPGNSSYGTVVKGLTKNLRESTTNAKVREYHKTFYRPDNLSIIITGDVDANDIFKNISPIIEKILQKGVTEKFASPWHCSVSPLSSSKEQVVMYPSYDSNGNGTTYVAWRGSSINQIEDCIGLDSLIQYLCASSSSPLRQAFLSAANMYCDDVVGCISQGAEVCIYISFQNVLRTKQSDIKRRLLEILNDISNGKQDFNMKMMSVMLHKKKIDILTELEANPHDILCSLLTTDFLYGQSVTDLEARMNQIHILENLAKKDALFWKQLLKKYLLAENVIVIIGEPSIQLQEKMSAEESKGIAKQKEMLGKEGLECKETELHQAKEKNKEVVQCELFTSLLMPSAESIKFHQIVQSCNYEEYPLYDCSLKDIQFGFQLDNIKTNFVNIWLLLDTAGLSLDLQLYVPLFMDVLVKSVITQERDFDSWEEISAQVSSDIIDISVELSRDSYSTFTNGMFDQIAVIKLKIEETKYEAGIKWLHEVLYERKFTQSLIEGCISKMIQMLSSYKGINEYTAYVLSKYLTCGENSNSWCGSSSRQYKFLKSLQDANFKGVTENLEKLRSMLLDTNNIVIHIAANIRKLGQKSLSLFNNLLAVPNKGKLCRHTIQRNETGLHQLESSKAKSYIVDAGPDAQCLMFQLGKGINLWNDPDFPALRVLIFYLIQKQGSLQSLMENNCLSYLIWNLPDEGIVYVYIAGKDDLVGAYKLLRSYVCDLLNGKIKWDKSLIEVACSGAITNIVEERESTVLDVSMHSLLSYYNGVSRDYTRHVIDKIHAVTLEDLKKVGMKYLIPLFDSTKSAFYISSSTSALPNIVSGFKDKELSRDLHVITDDSIISDI